MGGDQGKEKKNFLLYGLSGTGKTLFMYQTQSEENLCKSKEKDDADVIFPTIGVNYEELNLRKNKIGIFDISGVINNYSIVNLICKSVKISGIIFIFSLNEIDQINRAKDALEMVLGNNFLLPNQDLYVIYNKRKKDNLYWVNTDLLDSRLNLQKLKEKYKLKSILSQIYDISTIRSESLPEGLYQLELGFQ